MEQENQLLLIFLEVLLKKILVSVKISDLDIDKYSKETRRRIGIVPQELNIDPFFTPNELLELQAGLYGIKKKNRKTTPVRKNLKFVKAQWNNRIIARGALYKG